MKDFVIMIILLLLAVLAFVGGIEIFVQFNLWLGGLMGMGYK